jgi:excisionase family DNA binding protein
MEIGMTVENLADDLLDGVPAIAAFLGLPQRRIYDLVEKKKIPAFKMGGGRWSARKSTLCAHIEKLEAQHV